VVNDDPPILTVSAANYKDTAKNIMETKEFVVNLVSEPIVQAMNSTALDGPPETDEWKVSGLSPIPSVSHTTLVCHRILTLQTGHH
jgi:flavin reductase (DIM6/NTAB) family NADH-FMN oxidoreductase RutF